MLVLNTTSPARLAVRARGDAAVNQVPSSSASIASTQSESSIESLTRLASTRRSVFSSVTRPLIFSSDAVTRLRSYATTRTDEDQR